MESVLNPIQQRIQGGMSPLQAIFTDATCGEACWDAREDLCRCSCGGKNHGCLRGVEGVRPVRNCKLQGYRYELNAAGYHLHREAYAINLQDGQTYVYAAESHDLMFAGLPAKIRHASDTQVEKWPELLAYRTEECWTEETGHRHWMKKPELLWIRVS